MAENYKLGKQRIFYRSKQFKENVAITADMLDPFLNWTINIHFEEAGKGLYYIDFDFAHEGTYVVLMYEDGEKVLSQNFFISSDPSGGLTFLDSGFKGPSVINNN